MLKYVDTRVCFQEVPDEISLCINLSGCPHRCEGCHSSYLQDDIGEPLDEDVLDKLIEKNKGVTCICFMGGDNAIPFVLSLGRYVRNKYKLKSAWYSGLVFSNQNLYNYSEYFDYVKTGPFIKSRGPLTSPTTNQKFYKLTFGHPEKYKDITYKFWKNESQDNK